MLFDQASNLYAKLDCYSGSSKDIDKTLHKSHMPDEAGRANQTETVHERDAAEWSCPTCTYLNKISDDSCEMC